jgi:predicted DNA-binding transcriptional regulator YafY
MRASRLIDILTTLQARGRVTARALAAQCEVSQRTIYRDVDALAAAGVPVYSDRGPNGGYRLLDSYRTRLNGMTQAEAEALFLSGVPDAAAELGLVGIMAAAQLKLVAALPTELRAGANAMRSRFLFDAPGWFAEAEHPPHLRAVADALWASRRLRLRYRSWKGIVERIAAPLGLVLKSNAWYLVAAVDGTARTYRVANILDLDVCDDSFERPASFDLEAYWRTSLRRFESELFREHAIVRLTPIGMRRLIMLGPAYVDAARQSGTAPDADGWREVRLPIESVRHAEVELLRLGAEAEVVEPLELRERLAATARSLGRLYDRSRT